MLPALEHSAFPQPGLNFWWSVPTTPHIEKHILGCNALPDKDAAARRLRDGRRFVIIVGMFRQDSSNVLGI